MKRKVHFFKILIGDFRHLLRIPPAFLKYVKKDMTHVTLECPNGMLWHVKLEKMSSGLYLQNGWEEFVKKHFLQKHDLLVFGYDGGIKFIVQIYDQSSCGRQDLCIKKTPPDCSCYNERKKRATRKNKSLDSSKMSHDKTPRDKTENHKNCAVPGLGVFQCDGHAKIEMKDVKQSITTKVDLRRQLLLDEAKERAREKAYNFTSKLPYFVVQMTNACVRTSGLLNIPSAFWKQHLPRVRMQMLLQSPDGTLWETNYFIYLKRGIACLSGGWHAFSKYHNLAAGDFCAFNLVDQNKMQAHIFRVIE